MELWLLQVSRTHAALKQARAAVDLSNTAQTRMSGGMHFLLATMTTSHEGVLQVCE